MQDWTRNLLQMNLISKAAEDIILSSSYWAKLNQSTIYILATISWSVYSNSSFLSAGSSLKLQATEPFNTAFEQLNILDVTQIKY